MKDVAKLIVGMITAVFAISPLYGSHEEQGLHFSHPLISESPSPDTKVRFDYIYENTAGEEKGKQNSLRFEGEYAFSRSLSAEIDVPYR